MMIVVIKISFDEKVERLKCHFKRATGSVILVVISVELETGDLMIWLDLVELAFSLGLALVELNSFFLDL